MPERPSRRAGTAGRGELIRLLVAGDSGAAGVGAPTQGQALCDHLVSLLSKHHQVQWCVLTVNGLDSPGLLRLLQDTPCKPFDVVVLSMGANDATRLCAPLQWARWQARLAELIDLRFAPALLVHRAVPPMHACQALPQPLRWFMGRWATQMNHSLAGLLTEQGAAPCNGIRRPPLRRAWRRIPERSNSAINRSTTDLTEASSATNCDKLSALQAFTNYCG